MRRIGERARWWWPRFVLLAAATVVAAAAPKLGEMWNAEPSSQVVWVNNCFTRGPGRMPALIGDAYAAADVEVFREYANRFYRAANFDSAASLLRPFRNDADLQLLAHRYEQLGLAWNIAHYETQDPAQVFPALREAWKLDLMLGGAFTDRLYREMSKIAPLLR
jgi:hypothetical protein